MAKGEYVRGMPMFTVMIHNPSAGAGNVSKEHLCGLLQDAGHDVSYASSEDPNWAPQGKPDLVVAAGGDGLVAKAAARLPAGIALAIIPLGIANNIAASLGIVGTPEALIEGWRSAILRRLDCWIASGAFGTRMLFEGAGLGALTDAIARFEKPAGGADPARTYFDRTRASLCAIVEGREPIETRLSIDGRFARATVVLLEVMNLPLVGPSLCLAPAEPDDGWLTIASAGLDDRSELCDWLGGGAKGPAPLHHRRCKTISLHWRNAALRLDDKILEQSGGRVEIRAADRKIPILVSRTHP